MFGKKKQKKKAPKKSRKRQAQDAVLVKQRLAVSLKVILVLAVIAATGYGIRHLLFSSGIFQIKNLKIITANKWVNIDEDSLRQYARGRNIFNFNLKSFERRILQNYPSLDNILIVRRFPDQLELHILPRTPLAQVHIDGKYFLVDRDAVVVMGPVGFAGRNIIRIDGVDASIRAHVGKSYPGYRLRKSLELIMVLKETTMYDALNITGINAEDSENIIINIEGGIDIRIGNIDFKRRLELLREAIKKINMDPEKIKYIDLRFDNLIIGSRQSG